MHESGSQPEKQIGKQIGEQRVRPLGKQSEGPLGEQLMFLSHSCRSPTIIWMDVEFVLWERFATWERFTTR